MRQVSTMAVQAFEVQIVPSSSALSTRFAPWSKIRPAPRML